MKNLELVKISLEINENKISLDKTIFISNKEGGAICKLFTDNSAVKSREEALTYAKLFAASPVLLKVALDSYLFLQKRSNHLVGFAIESESLRMELRNYISYATGNSWEEVQLWIEKLALES